MPIDITMPALSPTMETGTLAKWLIKVGDAVKSGDILCEIETDKATMEVESIDEGTVVELLVANGAEDIEVGAIIARLTEEGESAVIATSPLPPAGGAGGGGLPAAPSVAGRLPVSLAKAAAATPAAASAPTAALPAPPASGRGDGDTGRINASPLARRLAGVANLDLAGLTGSGPHGRIVKADVDVAVAVPRPAGPVTAPVEARGDPQPGQCDKPVADAPRAMVSTITFPPPAGVPTAAVKLSSMRRTIARRLTESKATVPHFYLTVDVRLDALLNLRGDLNASLEATGLKLSVNDFLIKALGLALNRVPDANVQFAGDTLYKFGRADVSVAVAIPGGLITPVITDAANKRLSVIAREMKDLAARAKDGKLAPHEYSGGTASISNLGMFGIKQFDAVINPPQGMILAVGAGELRPYLIDGAIGIATVMSATGSFDHRAIDGAIGAQFMSAFKALVENPLGMLA